MKLLALDIDGTLITKEHVLTEGVRSALLRAQRDYDTRIILASGRPTPALGALAEALQIADYGGYLMPFNGGKILEAGSKRLLSAQLLDADLIPQLYHLVQEHGVNILTYTEEHILTEREDDPYAEKEVVITGMPLKRVPSFIEAATESLPKCLAVGPLEKLIPLEAAVKEQLGTRVGAFRSSDYFLELVPLGVNKGNALARLLDVLGMTPQDLIAIGDNYNDLEMIELAGTGVAMGNAPEDIQRRADFVTRSNAEACVPYALPPHHSVHAPPPPLPRPGCCIPALLQPVRFYMVRFTKHPRKSLYPHEEKLQSCIPRPLSTYVDDRTRHVDFRALIRGQMIHVRRPNFSHR